MRPFRIVLSVVLFGVLAYIVALPYLTVYHIKEAAEKRDAQAMSHYIDFPSVGESLKRQMNGAITEKLGGDQSLNNPLANFGREIGGMFVDKVVEVYVTPSGLRQLMLGEKPKIIQFETAVPEQTENAPAPEKPLAQSSLSYTAHNRFVVKHTNKSGKETQFILHRQGLSWQLAEIILPVDE